MTDKPDRIWADENGTWYSDEGPKSFRGVPFPEYVRADLFAALLKQIDDCAIYLKPGETPRQRMDRDHGDVLVLLQLLAKEKRKMEEKL